MKSKAKDRIEAEVILRPANPTANIKGAVRAESVRQLEASPEAVQKVVDKLQALGFEVTAQSTTSVSIAGPSALFEKSFKAKLKGDAKQDDMLSVPQEINNHVEGIYIQRPPTYFDT